MHRKLEILYPYSDDLSSLGEVIDFTKKHEGHLLILIAYRLIDQNTPALVGLTAHKKLDPHASQVQLDELLPVLNNSGIQYDFSIEIGFMKDRIVNQLINNRFDFVLMDPKLTEFRQIQQVLREQNQTNIRILSS